MIIAYGAQVRLKSGGPIMTVSTIHPSDMAEEPNWVPPGQIATAWFVDDYPCYGVFHEDALEVIVSGSPN